MSGNVADIFTKFTKFTEEDSLIQSTYPANFIKITSVVQ